MIRKTYRPGGFDITAQMIEQAGFSAGDKILDIGCSSGATVFTLREQYKLDAFGIDINPDALSHDPQSELFTKIGDAHSLEYNDLSLDGIICECSFSLFDNPDKVLAEFNRVLSPNGRLMISDVYSKTDCATLSGGVKYLYTLDDINRMLSSNGFVVNIIEDTTQSLKEMIAQMIMENGKEFACDSLGIPYNELKKIKCGYFYLTARKNG